VYQTPPSTAGATSCGWDPDGTSNSRMVSVGTPAGEALPAAWVAATLGAGASLLGGAGLLAGVGLLAGEHATANTIMEETAPVSRRIRVSLARSTRERFRGGQMKRPLGIQRALAEEMSGVWPSRCDLRDHPAVPVVTDALAGVDTLVHCEEPEGDQAAEQCDHDREQFHLGPSFRRWWWFVDLVGTMMTSDWSSDKVRFDAKNKDQIPD
jgi:hypothetical protein